MWWCPIQDGSSIKVPSREGSHNTNLLLTIKAFSATIPTPIIQGKPVGCNSLTDMDVSAESVLAWKRLPSTDSNKSMAKFRQNRDPQSLCRGSSTLRDGTQTHRRGDPTAPVLHPFPAQAPTDRHTRRGSTLPQAYLTPPRLISVQTIHTKYQPSATRSHNPPRTLTRYPHGPGC